MEGVEEFASVIPNYHMVFKINIYTYKCEALLPIRGVGIDGDIPADRAGIKVTGDNKWLTIIPNAAKPDV